MVKFALPNFQESALLQQALTHRSYVNEHPEVQTHNERLEFLGDAILNFLSGEFLYKQYPEKAEGELTSLRSLLVDETQLSEFAIALDLGNKMRLGKGAELQGERDNPRLLSSVFEAVIGAYFLDQNSNIDRVRTYLSPLFTQVLPHLAALTPLTTSTPNVNYKSRFQEWAQANVKENPIKENPTYVIVHESGPDHDKQFVAEVRIGNQTYGQGTGPKKQEAEKDAARSALVRLGLI